MAEDPTAVRAHRRPHPALLLSEGPRAAAEYVAGLGARPLLAGAKRGDGHPVVVFPGFTASDRSTVALRRFLRGLGYHVHGWRLGTNLGPTDRILDGLDARFRAVHDQHGRTISLVGWSLGGVFARELSRREPDAVRQVITLASPFGLDHRTGSNASRLFDRLRPLHSARVDEPGAADDVRRPIPVPATNVYSRGDGIVDWRSCLDPEGPRRENVEVWGSHCGLGHNPLALAVIADRLAQPEGQWAPFRPPPRWARLYPAGRRTA